MPVITKQAASLEELLDITLVIVRQLPEDAFLWFRGASKGTFKLLPGLMRENKASAQIFDRERRLLTRFRQRSLPYWAAGYPQSDWEHLFAMQHYGMPTRLLDWTENLFVAAHVALSTPVEEEAIATIWCVNPIAWNRATPVLSEFGESIQVLTTSDDDLEPYRPDTDRRRTKSPVAMFGTHNSGRIVAQRGTFFIWGEDCRSLEDFANEMPLTELWKIEVVGDKMKLAQELKLLGFGETMVFPELTALATELARIEGWRPLK